MKTINFDFIKITEDIPPGIIEEKLENLNFMTHYFYSSKLDGNGNTKETSENKKKEIQKFLLKEYFNILLIKNNNNYKTLEIYENKLEIFLKDKIKITDIEFNIGKEFPQEKIQRKDILRQLVSKLNAKIINDKEAMVFQYGELYMNESNLNALLRGKKSPEVFQELLQVWMVFNLYRHVGLDKAFLSKNIEITKANEFFKNSLNYEIILKEKLSNNVSFENFWDAFNILNTEMGLAKETQKILLKKFTEELNGVSEGLFIIKDNVFYFNMSNMEKILKEPFSKDRKKELTKLYIIYKQFDKIKNPDYFSESMFFVSEYAQQTQEKLFTQVTKNYVGATYDSIKGYFNKSTMTFIQDELGCHAADSMLTKYNNTIIFNSELLSKKIHQENSSEEEKIQFALVYIVNKLIDMDNIKMQIWNKEEHNYNIIKVIAPKTKINEELLLNSIYGLNNNKLLNTIHAFFKDIELDEQSQKYLHNELLFKVLKINILQTGKNKDKSLIINKNIVLFNFENLEFKDMDNLLKIYIFEKIFRNKEELKSIQDNSLEGMSLVVPNIIQTLKNKISEKDIYTQIKIIEKDLEISPNNNYKEFHDLSIELDAKNDLSFMKNEMVIFKHEKKTDLSTVFIRLEIINKLLNKTIDSSNVKELVKVCLFSKLIEVKDGILRNKNNHLIVLNENCLLLSQKIPEVIEKINGKVLEKEVESAIIELNENMPFDSSEDYLRRNVINEVKRDVGIKIKSPFKHLL